MKRPAIWLIVLMLKFYKYFVSPLLPRSCRFYPSCSDYAMEAVGYYGIWKGSLMALRRIVRCNPFSEGGFDPVVK